jgi:short-subunit dehydrogenase
MHVKNKTMVVTGGGMGLGRELVLMLLARGARVAAVDMNESALLETTRLAGDKRDDLSTHVLDITDRAAVEMLSEQLVVKYGEVDGLINNAGIIQPFVKVNDIDYATINRVVNVDFYGTLYTIKAFLPHFLKRPEAHIVNISSMGGLFPVPGESVYGAAKAAVKLLTEGLRAELRNTNVNLTLVFPGGIATNIKYNSGADEKPSDGNDVKKAVISPVQPARAARVIIDAIEKKKFRLLIGKDIKALSFVYRICPACALHLINRQMKSHIPD